MTKKDEVIDQIQEIRHIISEENGHNPQRLVVSAQYLGVAQVFLKQKQYSVGRQKVVK